LVERGVDVGGDGLGIVELPDELGDAAGFQE
jgi:hypothetical protein